MRFVRSSNRVRYLVRLADGKPNFYNLLFRGNYLKRSGAKSVKFDTFLLFVSHYNKAVSDDYGLVHSRSLLPRSKNIAEGWHRGFNSMLGCSKLTIWKFLDRVKAEQSLTDMKKTKQIIKERPEQRAARWINYDRRIQDYQNYANKIYFLKAIGNLTM